MSVGSHLVKNSFAADSSSETASKQRELRPGGAIPSLLLASGQVFQHARGTQCALLFSCRKKNCILLQQRNQRDCEDRNAEENIRINVSS